MWTRAGSLLSLLLASLLSGCPSSSPDVKPAQDAAWTSYADPANAVSLSHPKMWRAVGGHTPEVAEKLFLVATVTNFDFPEGPSCAHAPVDGLKSLPDDGIIITIYERLPTEIDPDPTVGFDPKPARFGPWMGDIGDSSPECPDAPDQFSHWFLNIEAQHRAFHILVIFGPRATPESQASAWRVLDSLEAESRSS